MKKNLLKKASVYFINFLVVLMIVVLPVATVQAASQIETPIETRSKQNSNLEGGGDLSYINLSAYTNRFGTAASGRAGKYTGPRGTYVTRDWSVNSGVGLHGGSYWKLYNRSCQRIGTYDKYGNYLRP